MPSLTLGPGLTVVEGLNGSGKSTLLRLLATVVAPDRGRITVAGRSLDDPTEVLSVRRSLGHLPQRESVPPQLTVFDHVDVVAVMREIGSSTRDRRAMVRRALVDVGLDDLASTRCRHLSGGQRRRVAIAAAMVGNASLLVLDEPDASLDVEQLERLAIALTERARTANIVMASHHPEWSNGLKSGKFVHIRDGMVTLRG